MGGSTGSRLRATSEPARCRDGLGRLCVGDVLSSGLVVKWCELLAVAAVAKSTMLSSSVPSVSSTSTVAASSSAARETQQASSLNASLSSANLSCTIGRKESGRDGSRVVSSWVGRPPCHW